VVDQRRLAVIDHARLVDNQRDRPAEEGQRLPQHFQGILIQVPDGGDLPDRAFQIVRLEYDALV